MAATRGLARSWRARDHRASIYRVIGAIFLGASSDDANLLVIQPKRWQRPSTGPA